MDRENVIVIGGGLAGSEAAWQVAQRGLRVVLYEMRPVRMTPAHVTDKLAELVCSNSLGSTSVDRAPGLLKAEMARIGSLILSSAEAIRVPAGGALAVDRELFAEEVTRRIRSHPLIEIRHEEVTRVPTGHPTIIATGPLTSQALANDIQRLSGEEYLYFYDAMAPIVEADSIDMEIAWRQSRYDRGESDKGDYINCPLSEEPFGAFVQALLGAERLTLRDFEQTDEAKQFFEGCLPVEVLASRGEQALAFGPMRPVGLIDPRTGRQPYAVVQLRRDNLAGTLYNMVGFQTNLRWPEQKRVFRLIPGLENAAFVRLGQMHRNTFIHSPSLLEPTMRFRRRPDLFFAGQITGVEGYVGNAGTGLLAGVNATRVARGCAPITLPPETMLGALCFYVTHAEPRSFQPMKANFGIMPPLRRSIRNKRERYAAYARRSLEALEALVPEIGPVPADRPAETGLAVTGRPV
ncbi:MAG TPA: methylenetetrahydrofolate--tRNA-(uracil(54)-C(5))-methyltransferase (FADH(2)-oxidizing) TrmFO [Chloroflexi bacterium]|nr:methylenetetrahydrofolate--tRNA-(uracil(54)-C(5))-methyltransferase (FADH(2)-oxidizing) TrmFO [Chloroflexota bacterium]